MKIVLAAICGVLALSGNAFADTFEYNARNDFDSLDGGAVPYYKDNPRDALAVNAAIEEYRDEFARATTTFSGTGGLYDVTISALGEIDGECEYRFLVDGEIVGTAINNVVAEDYEVIDHVFTGINIPAGAEISVESKAVTNGLIPEGNGTAFARGRWRTLTLDSVPVSAIDMAVSVSASTANATVGELYALTITATNNSTSDTATNPLVTLSLPADTTVSSDGACNLSDNNVSCALTEIAAGESASITLNATTNSERDVTYSATVTADQPDDNNANNTTDTDVSVSQPVPASVDLALAVTSDLSTVTAGQSVTYQITVQNQHPDNTATAPVAGVALPDGLTFTGSADCAANGQIVSCDLPELAPDQSASVALTAATSVPGSAVIVASVSANEPETTTNNNEATHTIAITENRSNESTESTESTEGNVDQPLTNSGAGSMGQSLLSLMLLSLVSRQLRRKLPQT